MKWEGNRESSNVEDRRGGGFGGGGGIRIGGGGIGLGTIAIALVGGWLLGINPLTRKSGDPKLDAGFALSARAGFAFIAKRHHWLGVVVEAYPAFYGDETAFGMSSILQWQYY